MSLTRFGIVGGGIIGLAVARTLMQRHPDAAVTVVDKESRLAAHQTGHNSGVVHAGIYYKPGSLKARLCRRGRAQLLDFCAEHGIPYERCGKLVVALDDAESEALKRIHANALLNGVDDVRLISASEIAEIEPHAGGRAALHSPSTAIVDFRAVADALGRVVEEAGGIILLGNAVTDVVQRDGQVELRTNDDRLEFDRVVVCAGLHTDRVARMAGDVADPQIVPFRGEYYRLRDARRSLVRAMIYPVPDPRYPFLGLHATRGIDDAVHIGPNAVLALSREGYRWSSLSLVDLVEILRWPGMHAVARRHWRTGAAEVVGSLSKAAFVRRARRYLPDLRAADVVRDRAGVRAQAIARDGALLDDFAIHRVGSVVAVRNAPSPAATSSFAIAEHICDQLEN